jgi:hypothetical protein
MVAQSFRRSRNFRHPAALAAALGQLPTRQQVVKLARNQDAFRRYDIAALVGIIQLETAG